MTYTAGSRIESSDYNTFVSDVNNLWGTGSGNKGYGQSSTVGTVAGGGQVTATQWSTLASRVNSIRTHQTGSGAALTNQSGGAGVNISSGQRVYAVGNMATQLSNANTAMTTYDSRYTSTSYTYVHQGTSGTSKYIGANPTTPTSIYVGATITWGSFNQMRYWFNAGGFIDFTFTMTNAGTSKTQSWSNLCTDMGTIRLGGLASGPLGQSGGFTVFNGYTVMNIPENGTWNRWYLKYNDTGVADYNANYLDGYLYRAGGVLNFLVYAYDNAGDTFYGYPAGGVYLNPNYVDKADYVDYPLNYYVNPYGPSTAYGLANTWGTPSVSMWTS
jgi:hypothetical protein